MMEKQTIVVKVGTSSLTLSDGTMDAEKIRNITTQLAALQTAGHHVILVSSGAIAAGFSRLCAAACRWAMAVRQAQN